ncbi:MAG: trypsin-like peptidase domain-containing protein [Balneolales bacterium]
MKIQQPYSIHWKTLTFSILLIVPLACSHNIEEDERSSERGDDNIEGSTSFFSSTGNSNEAAQENPISISRENAITNTVKSASNAVVGITVTEVEEGTQLEFDPFYGFFLNPRHQREFQSLGSGFIVSEEGHVVTNEHLSGRSAKTIKITTKAGKIYDASLIGADKYTDLALLKIQSDEKFPFLDFGDSEDVIVGEWSIAIGNPFGLFEDGQPTVTVGVVSATKRNFQPNPREPKMYLDMIQTDAAINRGNSGGPLLNANGEVIGVNTFIYTGGTSDGFVGLGFAIPSNRVVKIINYLAGSGEIALNYDPGFDVVSIDKDIANKYNLSAMRGLLVTSVNKDGPAYESGILPGDIIMRIGTEFIHGKTHAWALFREYDEGDQMKIELLREGNRYEAKMSLRKRVASE